MNINKNSIKIIGLGIILLIIAGIIVIALKGFNVSLIFGKHEIVELNLETEINLSSMKDICNEVFPSKKHTVKRLELFNDSIQISVQSITDEEKENLINKINETFETEKELGDLNIHSVSNKRIRDIVKPYVAPMLISFGIVFVYMLIRFRKIEPVSVIIKLIGVIILTEFVLLSIIAITRIPVSDLIINILIIVPVIELILCISKCENKLQESENK